MTEKELIILLKEGDEKAFTTLYRRYWSKVYNFSRLYLSSILEIEEVVQEVFVKVWESRSLLREDDNFKGFLFVITRNLVFNQFRRSFNENAYKLTVLSSIMPYYNLEEELTAADLQGIYRKNGQRASSAPTGSIQSEPKCSLTYKEISIRLNISEKNCRETY